MIVLARALRGVGELLITAGLVVLLFVVWELYWTDLVNAQEQHRLRSDLTQQFAAARPDDGASAVDATSAGQLARFHGQGFAVLYIPRLGGNYAAGHGVVVVEGTDQDALADGPGHYSGTPLPGQPGNVGLAGHRVTHGKPFNRLDEVRTGDHVVLETASAFITYRVTGETVVDPGDVAVVDPHPPAIGDQGGADHLITMTTCNPKYSATTRLVLRGVLESSITKASRQPVPALQPGRT